MVQVIRCPLTGLPCGKPITIQEKSFFLAEAEKPEEDKKRRIQAVGEAIQDSYEIRSALDEKGINAFTCKICEMIQTCAYGMADITQRNPNVLLELGMMIALGKPTIILSRKGQEEELKLPSDLSAIEIIPFTEYIDIIDQLRKVVQKLPPAVSPSSLIQDLERIQPQLAEELKQVSADIVKEFKKSIDEAKLDTVSVRDEKKKIAPELSKRLQSLEEKLEDMTRLGFTTDAKTAFLRGLYYRNQGKNHDALAAYNWSLEIKPDDPTVLNNRGNTYAALERYDEAIADYNHSLELEPDNPSTLYNRGTVYSRLGRYDESLADLNRSLELRPNQPDTLYNLACLFSLWGKPNDALAYLERAIKKDKKYREMAKTDKDFNNMKDDPRFKKLIEPA